MYEPTPRAPEPVDPAPWLPAAGATLAFNGMLGEVRAASLPTKMHVPACLRPGAGEFRYVDEDLKHDTWAGICADSWVRHGEIADAIVRAKKRLTIKHSGFGFKIDASYLGSPSVHVSLPILNRDNGSEDRLGGWIDVSEPDEELIIARIREKMRTLLLHELDECIYVDGVRRWDPHPPDKTL